MISEREYMKKNYKKKKKKKDIKLSINKILFYLYLIIRKIKEPFKKDSIN